MPLVLLLLVALLLLTDRQQPPPPPVGGYYLPGARTPGEQLGPPPGAAGGPSTRTQIETGVGALAGAGAGAYLCAGSPACIALGAGVGGTVAPYVSRGAEVGAKKTWEGLESAYGHTLGKIF